MGCDLVYLEEEQISKVMREVGLAIERTFQEHGINRPAFSIVVASVDEHCNVIGDGQYLSNADRPFRRAMLDCVEVVIRRVRRNTVAHDQLN